MTPELQALALNPWLCMVAIGAGIIGSFLKKLYDLEQTGTIMPPLEYWRLHPYGVLLCWFSAYLLGGFWLFSGLLNVPLALLTGVSCDYAFDTLRAKAVGRIRDDGENSGT